MIIFPFSYVWVNLADPFIHFLYRLVSGPCINLVVGEGEQLQRYSVHKALLCARSEYFESAFRIGFKEGAELEMKIPEDEPATVAAFVAWVYSGNLDHLGLNNDLNLKLYRFADKIRMVTLQNKCLDCFRDILVKRKRLPEWALVDHHFRNSLPFDSMRKLHVDVLACYFIKPEAGIRKYLHDQEPNHDLATDVFCRLNEVLTERNTRITAGALKQRAFYHIVEPRVTRSCS